MRAAQVSQTGIGVSAPVPVDFVQVPTNISLFTNVIGMATYSIQHTYDDVFKTDINGNPLYNPLTGNWMDNTDMSNITGNGEGRFDKPVSAFRIRQLNGNGTVQLLIRQGIGQ